MENLFNLVTLARVYFKDRWLIYGVGQTNEKGTHNYIIKQIYKEENQLKQFYRHKFGGA